MTENKQKDTREGNNDLGISKGVYALGHSFKDALIWGTLATLGSFAVLALGRKRPTEDFEGNFVDKVATLLEKGHDKFKEGLNFVVKRTAALFGKEISAEHDAVGPATTATAVIVGSLVGHAVQIPSGASGFKKAKTAIQKYDDLSDENRRLANANAALTEQNRKFVSQLSGKDASFTERVQKDAPDAVSAVSGR